YGKFFNDKETALLVAKTLYKIDPWIILVGPSGPIMEAVKQEVGLRTAQEVYLGKRYSSDGKIIANRFHENLPPQAILEQARQLMADSSITAQDGKPVKLTFNTLHISPRLGITPDVAEKLNVIIGQPISLAMAAVGTSGWI
ncbi:MAG: LamB/YcsF family protein, partial [Cyanobacteria bacterium]|nr:LamB/YcsF family protein [Cyanobacteriota bacterium]